MELVQDFLQLIYRKSHSLKTRDNATNALRGFDKFCTLKYNKDTIGVILAIKDNSLDAYKVLNDYVTFMDEKGIKQPQSVCKCIM